MCVLHAYLEHFRFTNLHGLSPEFVEIRGPAGSGLAKWDAAMVCVQAA